MAIISWPIQCLFLDGWCQLSLAAAVFAASGRLAFTGCNAVARRYGNGCANEGAAVDRYAAGCLGNRGDTAAMRRLRMIHWGGMLANFVILSTLAMSARFIL
jgi:hypothetical protein